MQEVHQDDDDCREQDQAEEVGRADPGRAERLGVEDRGARPAVWRGDHAEQGHGDRHGPRPPATGQSSRRVRGQHDERREVGQPREPVQQCHGLDAGRPARRGGLGVEEPVVRERHAADVRDRRWHVVTELSDQGEVIRHVHVRRVGASEVMLREERARRIDEQVAEHRASDQDHQPGARSPLPRQNCRREGTAMKATSVRPATGGRGAGPRSPAPSRMPRSPRNSRSPARARRPRRDGSPAREAF